MPMEEFLARFRFLDQSFVFFFLLFLPIFSLCEPRFFAVSPLMSSLTLFSLPFVFVSPYFFIDVSSDIFSLLSPFHHPFFSFFSIFLNFLDFPQYSSVFLNFSEFSSVFLNIPQCFTFSLRFARFSLHFRSFCLYFFSLYILFHKSSAHFHLPSGSFTSAWNIPHYLDCRPFHFHQY